MPVGEQMERLVAIMARLRAEGGCPWDREQDLRSLRPYLVEEAYEVLEAMDAVAEGGPMRSMVEELGDLLFQVVFHAQLGTEQGCFGMEDVVRAIADKIESRHPHVFGGVDARTAPDVLSSWAKLKAEERLARTGQPGSALDGVPVDAPGLTRSERLSEKASRAGFDFADLAQVRAKVGEELNELDKALGSGNRDRIDHELGDLLFALANLGRFTRTPAEDAVRAAARRFTARFKYLEQKLRASGRAPAACAMAELDALWEEAKRALDPRTHSGCGQPVS